MAAITSSRPSSATRLAVVVAGVALALSTSVPAAASGLDSVTAIEDALCPDGTAALDQDVTETGSTLTVSANCEAVLDLGGYSLTIQNVVLETGSTLTVQDSSDGESGSLNVDAAAVQSAGIRTTGATLVVESGNITAQGGGFSAGIGGEVDFGNAADQDGGVVTISGGTIEANGGGWGAGIGGGRTGKGGVVTISGGTVTATGGNDGSGGAGAAGIGGGSDFDSNNPGDGGDVTITCGTVNTEVVAIAGTANAEPIGKAEGASDSGTLDAAGADTDVADTTSGGLPRRTITFASCPPSSSSSSSSSSVSTGPSYFAPGGTQPSQAVGTAAFVGRDGVSSLLTASDVDGDAVRYSKDDVRVTFLAGAGTDAERGVVVGQTSELVCEVCAEGLTEGQVIEVWLFSTPRLIAAHRVDDADCQEFVVPLGAPLDGGGPVGAGEHTVQFALATADGPAAVNIGVSVSGPVPSSIPAGGGPALPVAPALAVLAAAGMVLTWRFAREHA